MPVNIHVIIDAYDIGPYVYIHTHETVQIISALEHSGAQLLVRQIYESATLAALFPRCNSIDFKPWRRRITLPET